MINVTETAASKISELLVEEQKANSGLRVFVQGGGCSGFQYGLMIEESLGDSDQIFESNGVKLYVESHQHSLPEGGRGRLRRNGHWGRLYHQEPECGVDLRVRPVVYRLSERQRPSSRGRRLTSRACARED